MTNLTGEFYLDSFSFQGHLSIFLSEATFTQTRAIDTHWEWWWDGKMSTPEHLQCGIFILKFSINIWNEVIHNYYLKLFITQMSAMETKICEKHKCQHLKKYIFKKIIR